MSRAGIYKIENTKNGKTYIGASYDITNRISTHKYKLRNGKNSNRLQKDWDQYGEKVFVFKVLTQVGKEWAKSNGNLEKLEENYIKKYHPEYNIREVVYKGVRAKISSKVSGENNPMYGRDRKGEKNKSAKLTKKDVKNVKQKIKKGNLTHKEIANEYGVVRTTISNIAQGLNWDYVKID